MALKRVDLPTLGSPTIPARRLMLIRAARPEDNRRARLARLHCQCRSSADEPHGECRVVAAGVNPANAEPSARDTVVMGAPATRRRSACADAPGPRRDRRCSRPRGRAPSSSGTSSGSWRPSSARWRRPTAAPCSSSARPAAAPRAAWRSGAPRRFAGSRSEKG